LIAIKVWKGNDNRQLVYDNYPINQKKKAIKQGPPVTVTPCSSSIISNRKEEEKEKKTEASNDFDLP